VDQKTTIDLDSWISCHIYYHEDPGKVALELLPDVVSSHLESRSIDKFFFVRYGLGGPHLRLRLRTLPGLREHVIEATRQAALEFMDRAPSRKPLPEETIQQVNRSLMAADAHETDDTVYPDNSFHVFPFQPEVQRYGGPGLLLESLEFFAASSSVALDLLRQHASKPRGAQLVAMFHLLLQQALGFAKDEDELCRLVGYGFATWGDRYPGATKKGKEVFLARKDMFLGLLRMEMESATGSLGGASRQLSLALGQQEEPVRSSVGVSQLHMTANRLGLTNPEEVYLGGLLSATLAEALSDGEDRARLRDALKRF
jgi:hypothetical protein